MSRRSPGPREIVAALGEAMGAPDAGEWRIADRGDAPERLASLESVFAVGNGFLGLRGTPEEGVPAHDPGTIVNGFHETWPIVYPEDAFGLARTGQTLVPCPDGSIIRLTADGEPFDLAGTPAVRHERVLDMRRGVLTREVEYRTSRGRRIVVRSTRLASLADRHLGAMRYEVHAPDGAEVEISSELLTHPPAADSDDPRRGKGFGEHPFAPVHASCAGARAVLELATRESGLRLACAMDHRVSGAVRLDGAAGGDHARVAFGAMLAPGGSVRLEKFVAYHWADAARDGLAARAQGTLDRATRAGYERVERAHRRRLNAFWRRSDATPPERYPLLLHHHPLELYRHQVIKQTDVVLATYLLDRSFSEEEVRRTFDFYDPLTTGDSTLSACVQSVVASAAGRPDAALRYFLDACSVDLLDSHGNGCDGLHIASCGGTWLALVAGFGGLRDFDGELRFDPRLPTSWDRLRFRVEVRGQQLEVDMTPGRTTYTLLSGPGLLIEHRGEMLRVAPGVPVVMPEGGEEVAVPLPLAA